MEKVLITGANGFIGSNISKLLIENGFDVYGTVREKSNLSLISDIPLKKIIADLTDIDATKFDDDYDYIIHCASVVSDYANKIVAEKNILELTVNFYEKVIKKQKNLKKLIFISTSLVLGYKKLNISETNPGKPLKNNYYVIYKKKAEDFLIENCNKDGLIYTILRPADVYGPRDRTSCYHMLKAIERGVPVIVGHGNYIFPYCSSKILAEAVLNSIKYKESDNNIYTVTSGIEITWKQFFSFFQKKFKKSQKLYIPKILAKIVSYISIFIHKVFPFIKPSLTPYRITRITTNTSYDICKTLKDLKLKISSDYEKELEEIYNWYINIKNKYEN